ncbi:MAG: DUF5666 domain-containing protein [Pseudomonadota bacterium]
MIRLALSTALVLGLLAGCAEWQGAERTAVETSVRADRSSEGGGGIGGTGAPSRATTIADVGDKEGGIGGTGIFGTVTAFGSIIVNGQTVDFSEDVVGSQAPIAGRDLPLSVGSTVIVEARAIEDGWTADQVKLFLPLIGPVSAIKPESGTLSVMGTAISLDDEAVIVDRRNYADGKVIDLGAIALGDRLAVSGIWRGGDVVASRVDRLDDEGRHALRGLLLETDDGAMVGGTRITRDCCGNLDTPAYVELSGRFGDDRFEIDDLKSGTTLLFSQAIKRLIVEAFIARDPDGEGFHLSGFGIPADQSTTVATPPGVRALFVGVLDDAFRIEESAPLPETAAAREEALKSLGDLRRED